VTLYGDDGSVRGELSTGPRGWQHAVVALDGGRLATAGDDRVLRVFDVRTRTEVEPSRELPGVVSALARQGGALVAGLVTGEVLRVSSTGELESLTSHPRPVRALAASAGAVASSSEALLRVSGGARVELDRPVGAAVFLSDTRLVIGVERDLALLDGADARWLAHGHRDDVTALAATPLPTGARLVSGGGDGTVRWWHEDGTPEGVLEGFAPGVQTLAVSAEGLVFVATRDKRLEAWRLPPRAVKPRLEGVPSAWAWWPDAGLVVGLRDGRLLRLEKADGEPRQLEARHRGPVRGIAANLAAPRPEAVRFVSGGDDGQVLAQRWNGEVEVLDRLVDARVMGVAIAPDGARAAWIAGDGTRVLWSLEYGKEIHRERDTRAEVLAFSPDSRRLALAREDKYVTLHDAETGKEVARLGPLDGAATALAWTPDGQRVAAGSADGLITVWEVATGKAAQRLGGPRARVSSLAVHSEGGLLSAGSDDGAAWLFDLGAGQLVAELPLDAGDVRLVAFTPDGLLAAGRDGVHVVSSSP
jgi:WD40 repeat protein